MNIPEKIVDGVSKSAGPLGAAYGFLSPYQKIALQSNVSIVELVVDNNFNRFLTSAAHLPDLKEAVQLVTKGDFAPPVMGGIGLVITGWLAEKFDIHPIANKLAGMAQKFGMGAIGGAAAGALIWSMTHSNGSPVPSNGSIKQTMVTGPVASNGYGY